MYWKEKRIVVAATDRYSPKVRIWGGACGVAMTGKASSQKTFRVEKKECKEANAGPRTGGRKRSISRGRGRRRIVVSKEEKRQYQEIDRER